MRRQAGALAAVAALALLAAGCGGGPTVTTALTSYQKALAFQQMVNSPADGR